MNDYKKTDIVRLWARQCDVTGEGMNEGWCWGDGVFYTKYRKDTINEIRNGDLSLDHLNLDYSKMTDDELLQLYFDEDVFYYTEWNDFEDEEDFQYAEFSDGTIGENPDY